MSVFTNSSVVKTQIEAFGGAQGPAGPQGIQGIPGEQGQTGPQGPAGVSPVVLLERKDGGVLITVTDAQGTRSEMVYDGEGGAGEGGGYYMPSVDGSGNLTWTASRAGMPSVPGTNIRGPAGATGATGAAGAAGDDGYTPVRGTDYWTEADQQQIVSDVLAALPTWEGGSY